MEYSIQRLAKMAGVSTRTLRYYDEIGLLEPIRKNSAGVRIYSSKEVDRLQQILFYKHLGVDLNKVKEILDSDDFNELFAMEKHLVELEKKKRNLEELIDNVNLTIKSMKGEIIMSDEQKFEAFKEKVVKNNEDKYGKEIRGKYGDDVVNASNDKIKKASKEQWNNAEELAVRLNELLKEACREGNPKSEKAQKVCEMHKEWIQFYWGFYSKEAHLGLCQMYTEDERFKEYYEKITPGATEFLLEAMKEYLK